MSPRPRTTKKKFHVALEPDVMEELKRLSEEHSVPVGDVVEALLEVAKIDQNPIFLKQKILSGRDSFAMYIPNDPVEAEKVLLKALLKRRADKKFEKIDDDRENHGNK